MNGAVVLDKSEGMTSFGAVAAAKKIFSEKKVGHTGTLDPMATGVLLLLFGKACRAASLIEDTQKEYAAEFRLGVETDTQDSSGTVLHLSEKAVCIEELQAILPQFTGEILQLPPMYSALSQNGQRLYTLARQGITVEREKRPVTISELELLSYDEREKSGKLRISCSQGTYIRTLIDDMGKALGTYGIMTGLRRTRSSGFGIEKANTLEQLRNLSGDFSSVLIPTEQLFFQRRNVSVTAPQAVRFLNGGELFLQRLSINNLKDGEILRVTDVENRFLGLGTVSFEKGLLCVLRLFL